MTKTQILIKLNVNQLNQKQNKDFIYQMKYRFK